MSVALRLPLEAESSHLFYYSEKLKLVSCTESKDQGLPFSSQHSFFAKVWQHQILYYCVLLYTHLKLRILDDSIGQEVTADETRQFQQITMITR